MVVKSAKQLAKDAPETAPTPAPVKRKHDDILPKDSKRRKSINAPSQSESATPAKKMKKNVGKQPVVEASLPSDSGNEGEDDNDDAEPDPPMHESATTKSKSSSNMKFVPEGETAQRRNARTIFVGNLPVEVAKSKAALKGLIRLIVAQAPLSKIESTRFRSVAFKNPTAELPKSDDEDDSKKKKPLTAKPTEPSTKLLRQQGRASEWRSKLSLAEQDAEAEKPGSGKVFLNPAEKKKVAFIKKEFHDAADTIHAYIVFGHPDPARSKNVPPSLDPFEAARMAVEGCDGATYMGRTLRVDRVASGEGRNAADSGNSEARRPETGTQTDPKRSIFVGNLDFASKEEDLRVFFETLVKAERRATARAAGDGGDEEDGGEDGNEKTWVSHVRIVRDPDTQLGKGFAYVEFTDRESVDEILTLEEDKLKFAKRKLRVQRCKTKAPPRPTPSAAAAPKSGVQGERSAPTKAKTIAATPIVIPKGDPLLGERIRTLDKDGRKAAKASETDRVARRLAKKKARNAMERTEGKKDSSKGGILGVMKKGPKGGKMKAKVSRIRGPAAAAKRNMKK